MLHAHQSISSSTSTLSPSLFVILLESSPSSSATSIPLNSTPITRNSSFNSAFPTASASSTMQQMATVPSHSTGTSTSPVNTTQGAMTSSTSAIQTQSTNPSASQSMSTHSQSLPWSPLRKLLTRELLWVPFFDLWIPRLKWKYHWSSPKRVNFFPSTVIFRTSFYCHGFADR